MKKAKPEPIAVVRKAQAIDMTPIYYIRFLKPIRAGEELRWDSVQEFIERERDMKPRKPNATTVEAWVKSWLCKIGSHDFGYQASTGLWVCMRRTCTKYPWENDL